MARTVLYNYHIWTYMYVLVIFYVESCVSDIFCW